MIDLEAIREELADPDKHLTIEQCRERLQLVNRCWSDSTCDCHKQLLAERILEHYDALQAAAGKVRCADCETLGFEPSDIGLRGKGCLSCRALRALLKALEGPK